MFGGDSAVPLVLRSKLAAGTGYGSQHSMDPAGVLTTAPGLRVVAPSNPFDYVGLMNTALACDDPVVVLEHVDLYASTGTGPMDDLDYRIPVGKAALRSEGDDRHGHLLPLHGAVTAWRPLDQVPEVDADLIDLRWLDRAASTGTRSRPASRRPTACSSSSRARSAPPTAAGSPTRSSAGSSTGSTPRSSGSPARLASPSISKVLEGAALASTDDVVDALRVASAAPLAAPILTRQRRTGMATYFRMPGFPRTPTRRCWSPGPSSKGARSPAAAHRVGRDREGRRRGRGRRRRDRAHAAGRRRRDRPGRRPDRDPARRRRGRRRRPRSSSPTWRRRRSGPGAPPVRHAGRSLGRRDQDRRREGPRAGVRSAPEEAGRPRADHRRTRVGRAGSTWRRAAGNGSAGSTGGGSSPARAPGGSPGSRAWTSRRSPGAGRRAGSSGTTCSGRPSPEPPAPRMQRTRPVHLTHRKPLSLHRRRPLRRPRLRRTRLPPPRPRRRPRAGPRSRTPGSAR